jgi:ABC-type multidrug transport system ATPase subunit
VSAPLLAAERLTLERGARAVVRELSLELHAGETVALLGPNGAGKSTLLDGLTGALAPTAGTVTRRGRVAVALQSPDLARRSVEANVMLALAWWGVPRPDRPARAASALDRMGAAPLARRQAMTLSGGERRRVHLARVLALDADVLLLDEPFAGLDPEARSSLLEDSVSALRSDRRATLVVVHDRAEAWALADRLLIMIDGQLAAAGPPQELLERPPTAVVARFLGYDGWLRDGDRTLLTRPAHVSLDDSGPLRARVTRATALEDGFRLELELIGDRGGRLFAVADLPAPRPGDEVGVRVRGGAEFDGDAALDGFAMLDG